jgi:hypothetical protein
MANTIDFNVGTNAINVLNQTADAAENTAKGFTSAKAELRALNNQLLTMDQTSDAFKKASARAAELKDNISDLGAEINANAGNAFEGLSNNVGLFGTRLMSLDLKGAGQALSGMGAAVGKIDFKTVKDEVGGLVKGLGNLALSVVSNPFFLIAGTLAAIAYNYKDIYKWATQTSLSQQNLAKATDDLNKATEQELTKGAQKIAQVEILTARVNDNNLTEKERREALTALETMYPAYFANIDGDINDTEKLNEAKTKLVANILAEAKANAAKSLLEAEYAKKLALETEVNTKKGKFSQEQINEAIEAARFSQQTFFKEANQNLNDWWDGTEGIGKASLDLEQSIERIAFLEKEATTAVLANVAAEVKATHDKTVAAATAAQTEAEKKEAERQKELEANAVKAAKELKLEKELADAKLKVQQDYIKANQGAQANELYELENKKKLELQTYEGAEEDKVLIIEKYRLAEIEINKKYDDLALQQQLEADAKAKEDREKQNEANAIQAVKELEADKKLEEDKRKLALDTANARLEIAQQGFTALSALGDAYFSTQLANVQKGSKAELDLKKKQFAFNKKMQIGGAIMDTAKAITAAIAANPFPSPTLPVSIALASITGAAQIAKIASTKFDGGGGGGGGVNIPTTGADGTTAPSPANFAFLQNQPNQQPPLQAYVVGTQVSSNLEAQQLIQNQSRLGG